MPSVRQVDVVTPHFSLPFRFGGLNGAAFVNEQDSEDDLLDCVKCIIAYPQGSRVDSPDFGTPELAFRQTPGETMTLLHEALAQWEPRVDAVIEQDTDWNEFLYNLYVSVTGSGDE